MDTPALNPLAPGHIPHFVVAADGSDYLLTAMMVFTFALILGIGLLYLNLHALPEKMGHHANHSQMQIIGILALLALFTHNNLFWVVALLVAAFRPPDFLSPLKSIARSLTRIAPGPSRSGGPAPVAAGVFGTSGPGPEAGEDSAGPRRPDGENPPAGAIPPEER